MARRVIVVCAVWLCTLGLCKAGSATGDTTAASDTSLARLPVSASDTLLLTAPVKSTGLAMLLSAALPGAGQVYNESYWKAPIVLGLGIYFAAEFFRNNRRADDYRQLYLQTGLSRYYDQREAYKSQRDANAWYFLIVYVLNIVDAYVDASLYNFDVSPALSLRGARPDAGLSLRFSW